MKVGEMQSYTTGVIIICDGAFMIVQKFQIRLDLVWKNRFDQNELADIPKLIELKTQLSQDFCMAICILLGNFKIQTIR